jgi:hypothetical protein
LLIEHVYDVFCMPVLFEHFWESTSETLLPDIDISTVNRHSNIKQAVFVKHAFAITAFFCGTLHRGFNRNMNIKGNQKVIQLF